MNQSRYSRRLLILVVLIFSAESACSDAPPDASPAQKQLPPIPAAELERSRKACENYARRLCACAEHHPEFDADCAMAKAVPQALQMNIDAAAARGLTLTEQKATQAAARKTAEACFANQAKLDEQKCPRTSH